MRHRFKYGLPPTTIPLLPAVCAPRLNAFRHGKRYQHIVLGICVINNFLGMLRYINKFV